jgi:isoquinoline 1-oxidoreductase subunit beta
MNRRRFLIGSAAAAVAGHGFLRTEAAGASAIYAPSIWYAIDRAGVVTVHILKAEVGQHIGTAFAMIVAEELEVDWRDVRIDYPDPRRDFGILVTAGSWSVALNFDDLARFGAAGRIAFIEAGAKRLAAPVEECAAERGWVVRKTGAARVSYAELVAAGAVSRVFEDDDLARLELKPRAAWRLIGSSPPALDIPAKTDGSARFGIDMAVPGMLYAKAARPPRRVGAKPGAVDDSAARQIKEYRQTVSVADDTTNGSGFVLALAESYPAALAAAKALKVEWRLPAEPALDDSDLLARARGLIAQPQSGVDWWRIGDSAAAFSGASERFSAEYVTAAVAHAALEPPSALVLRDGERWHVYAGSAFQTRAVAAIADALDTDVEQVSLHQCYLGDPTGGRVEIDALVAAARAAKASGRPVKLIFDRDEALRFDFQRPLTVQRLAAALDRERRPIALSHDICSAWPLKRALPIALQPGADGKTKLDWSAVTGADSWYSFPNYRVRAIENDLAQRVAPAGFFRAASTGWTFWALESFIDELAHRIGRDAVALRLELLDAHGVNAGGPPSAIGGAARLSSAIRRAVALSGYEEKRRAKAPGRGIGLAASSAPDRNQPSWTACVAEIEVERATGAIAARKLTIVSDVGTAIHPDGVRAQIESAALTGLSVALYEQASFADGAFAEGNFDTYRTLRFDEVPELDIHVLSQGQHPTGAGEPALSVVAPAIANALFDATGARVRSLPMTPDKVKAAIEEAGR